MKKMLIGAVLFAVTTLSATAFAAPCTGNEAFGVVCNNRTTGELQTSCGTGRYMTGQPNTMVLGDHCPLAGSTVGAGRVIKTDAANTKTETSKEQSKTK
jgi:hypothetical protein